MIYIKDNIYIFIKIIMSYSPLSEIKCVEYRDNFLPENIHKDVVKNLLNEIEFNTDEESSVVLFGKKINVPRKQVGYGDVKTAYRYTGNYVPAKDWSEDKTPILHKIKEYVIKELKYPVSYVLINLYRDGNDYINYHSDDEKDLDKNYPIISISLGAERPFRFKHKLTNKVYEGLLKNNSLVLMKPPCQKIYKHSLPKKNGKKNGCKSPRINLTFRVMVKK
jgi:alpha-ketoglutarate-dependent dioxygenase alkB family protein 2